MEGRVACGGFFVDATFTRLNHPFFVPSRLAHVHTIFLPAQDDISHPDPERELVLRASLGVEAREPSDKLIPRPLDWYLRISGLWRSAHRMSLSRASATPYSKQLSVAFFRFFETACDVGVGRKVKLSHGCRGALEIKIDHRIGP